MADCLEVDSCRVAVQVTGLSGIEVLPKLKVLNLANTAIVTDSLLCCRSCPSLSALNIANTVNVNGDLALHYLAGECMSVTVGLQLIVMS